MTRPSEARPQINEHERPSSTNSYDVPWTWTCCYRHAPSEMPLIPVNVLSDYTYGDRRPMVHDTADGRNRSYRPRRRPA